MNNESTKAVILCMNQREINKVKHEDACRKLVVTVNADPPNARRIRQDLKAVENMIEAVEYEIIIL